MKNNEYLLNTYTIKINCKHNKQKYLGHKYILKLITNIKKHIEKESSKCNNCKYILDENYKIYDKEPNAIFIIFDIKYKL